MKWKARAIKDERIGSEPKPKYDDNAATMAKYHRDIILALADRYKGAELDEKLSELSWCSLETAREVINLSVISDVLHAKEVIKNGK